MLYKYIIGNNFYLLNKKRKYKLLLFFMLSFINKNHNYGNNYKYRNN